MLAALLMATGSAAAVPDRPPLGPAEAIVLADAHPNRGRSGTFRMTIAGSERTPYALYLNSSADYRASDDLTFHVTPIVAHALQKRFGAPPERFLRGRTMTVTGAVRAVPIANMLNQRPQSFNRYQHTVLIDHATQVIAVE